MMQANKAQIKVMTDFMEKNPDLAKSFSANSLNSRESQRMLWERLAQNLNANGPPTKSTVEWKRIWTTRKYNAKKKLIANKKSIVQTGGGPFTEYPLDSNEEAIIQACGIEAAVAGISGVSSYGCDEQDLEDEMNALIAEPVESTQPSVPVPVTSKKNKKSNTDADESILLAKKQIELQEKFICIQEEIEKSIKEVTISIKELKECIKLLCQEKEKERHSSNALKKEELQLKRMELELAKTVNELRIMELNK